MALSHSSTKNHQRQQVVELELEEGIAEKINKFETLVSATVKMDGNFVPGHSRHISDSYLIRPNPEQLLYMTDSAENSYLRGHPSAFSRRSSHWSELSTASNDQHEDLHPHIRFADSDFEEGWQVPSKRASHLNSHNSNDDGDGPLSQLIDNTRRDAVMTLSKKREKKAELIKKDSERSKDTTVGICKLAQYSISMSFQRLKEEIRNVSYTLELWYSSIKLIEGNFGSGVASYFKFLRWLFLLNSATLIISMSFLVVPQILSRFFFNADEVPDFVKNGGTYMEKSFSDMPDSNGTLPPPLTAAALYRRLKPYAQNSEFSATDLFTGEGFLTATSLYYGFYKSGTLELFKGYPYNLAHAYFFSMVVCYLIILISVSFSMASSYRKTFIETRGTQKKSFALKVFCGWDHSISTEEGAGLNKKRLFNEIKESLNEEEYQICDTSFLARFANVAVQIFLNFLFFCLMAGIALLLWDFLKRHSASLSDESDSAGNTMILAVITTLIMNLLPIGFSWIVRYENYHNPRTALFATLLRTFVLNVVVLGTISMFWLTHLEECWETALGQEVYRLFITDFFISVLLMGLIDTALSYSRRKLWKDCDQAEFDIAWNTLNLIYNQTLFLIGFYFSPLLAAVIVIKLFITFYIKKTSAFYNCQAPKKSWRAAQSETLFLILTFFALLGAFLVFGYIIFNIQPSDCGPFSGFSFMYEAILQGIFQLQKDNMFWKAVMYLAKPGVIGGVLIAMGITTYILRAKAQAHTIEVGILKNMLANETKDKAFLFKFIKRTEELNQKNGSPTISHSSSFHTHTPLSRRREIRKASREQDPPFHYLMGKNVGVQRKFHSTSHIAPAGSWSYTRGNHGWNERHQPSTSSGATKSTCDIELSQMSANERM